MNVEQVDFVSVPTRDVARAVAFYRDVLGLPESAYSDKHHDGNVLIFHKRCGPRGRRVES